MANILVIDDEESIRYTFTNFLAGEGHIAVAACNYAEGLAQISESSFDLIFSDIILGGRTGIDILREVRARRQVCPVVMVTGYPTVETAAEAVRLGAFDYVQKPVEQDALLHITRLALELACWGTPDGSALSWWDVPPAEVSESEPVRAARRR